MMINLHAPGLWGMMTAAARPGFQLLEAFQGQKQPFLRHAPGSGVLGGRTLLGMALKRAPRALGDQRMGRKGRASPGRDGSPFAPPVCVSSAGLSLDMASSEPHLNGGAGLGGERARGQLLCCPFQIWSSSLGHSKRVGAPGELRRQGHTSLRRAPREASSHRTPAWPTQSARSGTDAPGPRAPLPPLGNADPGLHGLHQFRLPAKPPLT